MNGFFDRLEAQLYTAAQAQTGSSPARRRTRWGALRTGARLVPLMAGLVVTIAVAVVALTLGSNAHRVGGQGQGVAGAGAKSTTSAATSTATTNPATASSGPPDCNAAGINDQQLRQGTCVSGANTVVVVNKTSTLHLKSLDANYVGFHRQGRFAIFTITIKDRLHTPQRWQHSMAALYIPGAYNAATNSSFYLEDLAAETGSRQSCLRKTGTAANGGLQPGTSVTCDVIFNVPVSGDPVGNLSTLNIANFGEDVSNPSRLPVGIIRTFH